MCVASYSLSWYQTPLDPNLLLLLLLYFIFLLSAMASSSASSDDTNPFATAPVPISVATAQLINIKSHVPVTLDLGDSNFGTWRTFFNITFRKFGLMDHVDGTVNAHAMLADAEWTQIDTCIVSWLYTTLSYDLLSAVIHPTDNAYGAWTAIGSQFLDNVVQCTVQARQAFHALHQADMTITEYCGKIKVLSDTLRDVGSPLTNQDLVVNLLSGLNDSSPTASPPSRRRGRP
ncbi:hypothetical protein C2845_PM10G06350 [Panicum miliaceum]|uniref:Retrotransposon Copia-like N-terminal domain-containing protein n=1 Tax=Panicum miliaceum TaxID=4540 RepID=A0A3L6PDZ1_PANMI|nr:hypothetical protein C2845_PM10G06350 [Panicum miliaceum]